MEDAVQLGKLTAVCLTALALYGLSWMPFF